MMKKTILALGLFLLPTLAMAAPDFNGSWVRDNANSDQDMYPLYWVTRAATPGGGGGRGGQFVITVHQDANKIAVTDSEHPMREYVLDGKPHTRATDNMLQKVEVNTKMQGNDLVIETTRPYGEMPGNVTMKEKQVWSLSSDGKTLTITTTRDVPAKKFTIKQVYNRAKVESSALCSAGCVALP